MPPSWLPLDGALARADAVQAADPHVTLDCTEPALMAASVLGLRPKTDLDAVERDARPREVAGAWEPAQRHTSGVRW